jgi:hypothetical protein
MTKEQIKAIIRQKAIQRIEERNQTHIIPDVFEVSNQTSAIKYLTKDGRVRLDIDFDEFKEIFDQAFWNLMLKTVITNDDDLMKDTPYRVRMMLEMYTLDPEVATKCEMIKHVGPMFDYRDSKK